MVFVCHNDYILPNLLELAGPRWCHWCHALWQYL